MRSTISSEISTERPCGYPDLELIEALSAEDTQIATTLSRSGLGKAYLNVTLIITVLDHVHQSN